VLCIGRHYIGDGWAVVTEEQVITGLSADHYTHRLIHILSGRQRATDHSVVPRQNGSARRTTDCHSARGTQTATINIERDSALRRTGGWCQNADGWCSITERSAATQLIGSIELTVTGTNFGQSAIVKVAGTTCPLQGGVLASSQILCTLPAGSGIDQPLTVSVGSQTSADWLFQYDPPRLSSVTPPFRATIGGTILTIAGSSFGSSGAVTIGGLSCPLVPNQYSSTSLQCYLPACSGKNQSLVRAVPALASWALITFRQVSVVLV
jgi:hypothetical protein